MSLTSEERITVEWIDADQPSTLASEYELVSARRALALLKATLTSEQIIEALGSEIEQSDQQIRDWTQGQDPASALVPAVVELKIDGLKSAAFLEWWAAARVDTHGVMLPASPEHYSLGWEYTPTPERPGRFRVVEAIDERATYFHMDIYADPSTAPSPVERAPGYSSLQVADCLLRDGTVILYVHHQYKDTEDGFNIRTGIFFASGIPEDVARKHREHLTVEWTNWVGMALAAIG